MSPNLEDLAQQASYTVKGANGCVWGTTVNLEKFALLIVTKCAVIATRCESNGTKNIGAEILEHFGVEL